MMDLIDRQAAIDAFNTGLNELVVAGEENSKMVENYLNRVIETIKCLPSAQPERIIYANMSDEEFEKWLYEHGICNPNIHEPIPCDVVPLLIDNAISELPSVADVPDTNVGELISRQAAIDALHTWFRDGFDEDKWWNSTHVLAAIKNLPSAQPEIIRCKDCKYWKRSSCCEGYCGEIDMEGFDEDHYCGFAERRGVTE